MVRPAKPDPPPLPALLDDDGSLRALLTPVLANAFSDLNVNVAMWVVRAFWYPFHSTQSVQDFEYHLGLAPRRYAYNTRSFRRVYEQASVVYGEHAGYSDVFVPVRAQRGGGVIVAGPFAKARPTSAQVLERWYRLTGEHGHLSDPSFADYLSATLATLTLEGPLLGVFEALLRCFADLVAGRGAPSALGLEATQLREQVRQARYPERMWESAHALIRESSSRTWGTYSQQSMEVFRLERLPEHVLVGLVRSRLKETDPVAEVLRRDAFQRAGADLARKLGNVVCGRVGDHGIALLVSHHGGGLRSRLLDLAAKARAVARRHGFELHVGVTRTKGALPALYQSALAAAERALSRGTSVEEAEMERVQSAERLGDLRRELGATIEGRPGLLSPRFDRYIEAVLGHTGYRLESTRAQLEAGLERLAEPLLGGGFIDRRTVSDLYAAMARTAAEARTVSDLVAAYRPLVAEIEAALQNPRAARHERSTSRALGFVSEHLSQPLSVEQVARVAGFAPDYFARMFRRREGVTFGRYVRERRLDRAKQMLLDTTLSVEQVQRQCGFRDRTYFHRLFKMQVGATPLEYRRHAGAT